MPQRAAESELRRLVAARGCFDGCGSKLGRGSCDARRRLCACASGWRGLDCSEPTHARTAATGASDGGFLYVYHPPAELGLRRVASARHSDLVFAAEYIFTQRMLADQRLRTTDPSRARLFYVPTWLYHQLGNQVLHKSAAHFRALVGAMRATDPRFNATWARNVSAHVFPMLSDKGACTVLVCDRRRRCEYARCRRDRAAAARRCGAGPSSCRTGASPSRGHG